MPIEQIADAVLKKLRDHQAHSVDDIVRDTAKETLSYRSDVKSAVLGLLRRDKLELTKDFKVKLH